MLLSELIKKNPRVECPRCLESFSFRRGEPFDTTKPMPKHAKDFLASKADALTLRERELIEQEDFSVDRSQTQALATNLGNLVEGVATSLRGFPAAAEDCRALQRPIDVVIFHGLSKGTIDAVTFADIKTGSAVVSPVQRQVREVVRDGA